VLEIVEGEAIRSTGAPWLCFAAQGAGQRGLVGREKKGDCSSFYAVWLTEV
jgi:hypothetical protein